MSVTGWRWAWSLNVYNSLGNSCWPLTQSRASTTTGHNFRISPGYMEWKISDVRQYLDPVASILCVNPLPGFLRWVYFQATSFSSVKLHVYLSRYGTNDNPDEKLSRNSSIRWGLLDGMCSTNRGISYFVYKPVSFKYNSNPFSFYCGFLFDFIRLAWI